MVCTGTVTLVCTGTVTLGEIEASSSTGAVVLEELETSSSSGKNSTVSSGVLIQSNVSGPVLSWSQLKVNGIHGNQRFKCSK